MVFPGVIKQSPVLCGDDPAHLYGGRDPSVHTKVSTMTINFHQKGST